MTTAFTDMMNQTLTYWAPTDQQEFGQRTLLDPVTVMCRWQQKATMFRGADGKDTVSAAVIYPATELQNFGWVALGDHSAVANPRDLSGAYEIRQTMSSPSLDADEELLKVMV